MIKLKIYIAGGKKDLSKNILKLFKLIKQVLNINLSLEFKAKLLFHKI
jgi:hypothetical protein